MKVIVIIAMLMMPAVGVAQSSAPQSEQTVDTATAAKALVPLLKSVRERLHPRFGVTGPGNPPPSPFTGTQTTLFSIGLGKKEVPVDPKVAKAMDALQAWRIGEDENATEAVLFDHWLTQLTARAAVVGLLNCTSACVVEKFTRPDAAFGRSPGEREETRDQLLLDALSAAVDEVDPGP